MGMSVDVGWGLVIRAKNTPQEVARVAIGKCPRVHRHEIARELGNG